MATGSTTEKIAIADINDLTASLEWFTELLPATAHEELAFEQARGNLIDPVTLVDGKKNDHEEAVKPFGEIVYTSDVGPLQAAIDAAAAFVSTIAPNRTGHYRGSMVWFANGQMRSGPPDAAAVGVRGNVELMDLAPYSAMVEIQVPHSVIYGAYVALQRIFGNKLSIGFRYGRAADYGGFMVAPGKPAPRVPYNIPILSIGNPASTVIPGVKRSTPGYNRRRRRRELRKYLKSQGMK